MSNILSKRSALEGQERLEAEILEYKNKAIALQDQEREIDDLKTRIECLKNERNRLIVQREMFQQKLKSHLDSFKEEDEQEEAQIEGEPEKIIQKKSLLKRVFSGWKEFSIQKAKLTLHLSMITSKRLTQVFTTWKRLHQEQRHQNLDILIAARDRRLRREREATILEEEELRKRKELQNLRERLETTPPKKVISKAKIERMKLQKIADAYWKKVKSNRAFLVFQEWKEVHRPYKEEILMKKKVERREIVRKIFNSMKEFSHSLIKKREIAAERRAIALRKLKKNTFQILKSNSAHASLVLAKTKLVTNVGPKKFFDAWKSYRARKLEEKEKIQFLRRRFYKIKRDWIFRMFKVGLSINKEHKIAMNKSLKVRETIQKRRRLYTFLDRTFIISEANCLIRSKHLQKKKQAFLALLNSSRHHRQRRTAIENLHSIEHDIKRRWTLEFMNLFIGGARRSINKQKVV